MVDALAIMKATRAGYEIYWQVDGEKENAWFRKAKTEKGYGPYDTLDQAAYAALAMDEDEHWEAFWKGKEDESS